MVGQAGGMLLTKTAVVTGLTKGLSQGLARWRKPLATQVAPAKPAHLPARWQLQQPVQFCWRRRLYVAGPTGASGVTNPARVPLDQPSSSASRRIDRSSE